jgi:hypothetical protein
MQDGRGKPRYRTLAHAYISGVPEGECLLKDLSITGCCIEYNGAADIQVNTRYQLEIKPEKMSNISNFRLEVESRWVRNHSYSTEAGMCIIASPKGKQFQRYVDYLVYRHSHP